MKKVISLLLSICMVACLGVTAFADTFVGINFTTINSGNSECHSGWTASGNTLTLSGLNYVQTSGGKNILIYLVTNTNIVLDGDNYIAISYAGNDQHGISATSGITITFSGEGSLTIDLTSCTDSNSHAIDSNISFCMPANFTETGSPQSKFYSISSPDEPEVEREEDPECDVNFDGTTKTVKYNNNTIVVDKWLYEHTAEEISYAYYVDLCDTNANIESIILKNDVVKTLNQKGHGFIVYNRGSTTVLTELDEDIKNSVTVTTKEGHATYAQKKAMNTEKVLAEVEYACTSNGKATNLPAFIIVPCESTSPRCFYLIDDNHIGEWPCTYVEGYCLFDRYLDGTYVICE